MVRTTSFEEVRERGGEVVVLTFLMRRSSRPNGRKKGFSVLSLVATDK